MKAVNTEPRLPSFTQVIGLMVGFISIIFLCLNMWDLPIQLGLFASWFLVIGLGCYLGQSYQDIQRGLVDGIHNGMEAVLVLMAVGALIGTWIAGGIVPNIIYYGLLVMNPEIFLPAAFVICGLTSLATGTSFGTVGTAGIAMIGIGASFGIPLELVAGAVISGAYVGDKMSPLSDTTVMTASLCRVDLIEHIKSMLYVSGPAALGAALLFLLAGVFYVDGDADTARVGSAVDGLVSHFTIGWYMLLPVVIVIGLLILRMPSIPVITFGSVLGIVWAALFQDVAILDAVRTAYVGNAMHSDVDFLNKLLNRGGMQSMFEVIVLILFALGLGGLMEKVGVLQVICNRLLQWATNPGRLTISTLVAGFFGNFFGGAAYVSLITASTITEKNYDQQNIDRRVLSRNVEAGGTMTTPMVPWSDGGVFMAITLGVTTFSYLPFLWYHFLVLIISVVYGFANIAIWRTADASEAPKSADVEDPEQATSPAY
jgi:Na+:H+ antiporter, NhaC family